MIRDLAAVLGDLHQGMLQAARQRGPGVRITEARTELPVDACLVLQDGGCILRADMARHPADAAWLADGSSRLAVQWAEFPTEALP